MYDCERCYREFLFESLVMVNSYLLCSSCYAEVKEEMGYLDWIDRKEL